MEHGHLQATRPSFQAPIAIACEQNRPHLNHLRKYRTEAKMTIVNDIKLLQYYQQILFLIMAQVQLPYEQANSLPMQQQVETLQNELHLLREMIALLINYEKECVDKVDLKGAKETRNRIIVLTEKEEEMKQKIVALTQDKQVMEMSQEQEDLIQCFDKVWSQYLNELVADLAQLEHKLKNQQQNKKEEIIHKFEHQKSNGFKPTTKLANLKRKVYGLMKLHNYQQAELESRTATKLQQQQRRAWNERVEQRQKNALQIFYKKANKQFEVLRSKNEDILFKKMSQRDNKFAILLKKHQVRRLQAGKSTKELIKSISATSLNTRRFQ